MDLRGHKALFVSGEEGAISVPVSGAEHATVKINLPKKTECSGVNLNNG